MTVPIGKVKRFLGFGWVAETPFRWVSTADQLRRAAGFVWVGVASEIELLRKVFEGGQLSDADMIRWRDSSVSDQWLFLEALAIENLLKACMTRKNVPVWESRKLSKAFKTHDLVALSTRAGLNLSDDERSFCEIGTAAIMESGRYPFGTVEGRITALNIRVEEMRSTIDRLYHRLRETALAGFTSTESASD